MKLQIPQFLKENGSYKQECEFNSKQNKPNTNSIYSNIENNMNHPCLSEDSLALSKAMHKIEKYHEFLLTKFNPDLSSPLEDHIKEFILAIRLMSI